MRSARANQLWKAKMERAGGEDGDLPPALHHKDCRFVVLSVDPVEQLPEVQVLLLAELEAVVDEVEAQHRSVGQGEEVGRLPHLLPLLSGEGGQAGAQPLPHASGILSVYEQRPGEPAQDVVQGALALPQALQTGVAGTDPVGGQRYGQLARLTVSVVAIVQMPDGCVSLRRQADQPGPTYQALWFGHATYAKGKLKPDQTMRVGGGGWFPKYFPLISFIGQASVCTGLSVAQKQYQANQFQDMSA